MQVEKSKIWAVGAKHFSPVVPAKNASPYIVPRALTRARADAILAKKCEVKR
jgi:hypothetical protein